MNEIGVGPSTLTFAGTRLSWTRDTEAALVQSSWDAEFRDVIILDPLNNKLETYNLGANPLSVPANKTALKGKLFAAATPADTDHDGLPDYWETWAYGNLSRNGATTGSNGLKTLQHWAHCSPASATGIITGLPVIAVYPSDGSLSVFFTRRRGTALGLTVTPEFSTTLSSWTSIGHGYEEWGVRTLYDGSGGERVEWHAPAPGPFPYIRVKAALP